jgi:hypothetical protein
VQNLRRGHYAITADLPAHDRVRVVFDELALPLTGSDVREAWSLHGPSAPTQQRPLSSATEVLPTYSLICARYAQI